MDESDQLDDDTTASLEMTASSIELTAQDLEWNRPVEEPLRQQHGRRLISEFRKAAKAIRLYPANSRIRREALAEFTQRLVAHVAAHPDFSMRIRPTVIWDDEYEIYEEQHKQRSLAFRLFLNGVRRIRFEPGLDAREAHGLVEVLSRSFDAHSTTDDLRTMVWERAFERIVFSITDDLLNDEEHDRLEDFLDHGRVRSEGARAARAEVQVEVRRLQTLPKVDPEVELFRLSEADRQRLAEQVSTELERDLPAEYSVLLFETLGEASGAEIESALEGFLGHILESGEILQAARLIDALRRRAERTADPRQRKLLVRAIEHVGTAQVAPRIEPLIQDMLGADRQALTMLLMALGDGAVPVLCDLLTTKARGAAEQALALLLPRNTRALLPFAQVPRAQVACIVVRLLGKRGGPDAMAGLLPALRHESARVRVESLRTVVSLGPEHAAEVCLAALDDAQYEVRSVALQTLAEVQSASAGRPLLERVQDRAFLEVSSAEQRETFRTLGRLATPEVVGYLGRTLTTRKLMARVKHDELRALAALALGLSRTPTARRLLEMARDDRSSIVARAAAAALTDMDRVAAEPVK